MLYLFSVDTNDVSSSLVYYSHKKSCYYSISAVGILMRKRNYGVMKRSS